MSVVSSGVGNSSASPEKWICPRFQFIIRSRRVQRRPIGRGRPIPRRAREGGQAAPWLPRSPRPCAPGSRPWLSLGGCPFCPWAGGVCHTHRVMRSQLLAGMAPPAAPGFTTTLLTSPRGVSPGPLLRGSWEPGVDVCLVFPRARQLPPASSCLHAFLKF